MKLFFSIFACFVLAVSSFGQTQGVSQRATNGIAFGEMLVNNHIKATNTLTTNTFAGRFQQGQGTVADGSGAVSLGLNNRAAASDSIAGGIGNQNFGSASFVVGRSNSIGSGGANSIVSGNENTAQDLNMLVSGFRANAQGSNSVLLGFDLEADSYTQNSFLGGQHVTLQAFASNNFAWNGDPASALFIPSDRSNSFTVNAPGGIYLNGIQFTNGGGSTSASTGMKTNQFTTNTVGVALVGNVNFAGATNNASGDWGVNGVLGVSTANAGTLGVSGNATVNGTLSSSTSTSGVFTVTSSVITPFTNAYLYGDGNGVIRATNNGSGLTNFTVYASNLVSGGTIPVGTLFTATTNGNVGGFLLETIGSTRYRTYNASPLTNLNRLAISNVWPVINAYSYGLTDSGGDKTAFIQAAVNAASNVTGRVILPARVGGAAYQINSTLHIPGGVTLEGEYAGGNLRNGTYLLFEGSNKQMIALDGQGITIRNILFEDDSGPSGNNNAIQAVPSPLVVDVLIQNCGFIGWTHGIDMAYSWNWNIEDCSARNMGTFLYASNNINAIRVVGCDLFGTNGIVARGGGCYGWEVDDCTFQNMPNAIIVTNFMNSFAVHNCYFEGNTNCINAGGDIAGGAGGNLLNGLSFRDNVIINNKATTNITIRDAQNPIIENNTYQASLGGTKLEAASTVIGLTYLEGYGHTSLSNQIRTTSYTYSSNGNFTVSGGQFNGNGAGLTNIGASAISNVATNNGNNQFSSAQTVTGALTNTTYSSTGTNYSTKLRVGGAAETVDAVNVTGSVRASGALVALSGGFNNILVASAAASTISGGVSSTLNFGNSASEAFSFQSTASQANTNSFLFNGRFTAGTTNLFQIKGNNIPAFTIATNADVFVSTISTTNYARIGSGGTNITNIRHGISGSMVLGTVTVTDAGCTANTRYFFSAHTLGTISIPGGYYASTRNAGTSFVITSSQATETSTIDWFACEP